MILKRKIDLLLAKSNGAQLMWLLGLSVASLAIAIVVAQWVFNDGTIVWQDVVAVFLDPGCFGGAGAHDWFRLILALLSVFLFSALLVSVFTNLFENIREAAQVGERRYALRGHVLILGHCAQLPVMVRALNAQGRTVVVVDEERPEVDANFIFYKAARHSHADLATIGAERASAIYVMGDADDPAHDTKNLKALAILDDLCRQAPQPVHCYVTLADYATIEVLQYQRKAGATGQLLVDTVNAYEYEAEQLLVGDTSPASGAYSATASPAPSEVFLPVLRQGDERRAHIVIIGTGAMAQSVAYTVAHLCHYPNYAEGGQRTRITFIGEDMEAWQQHLVASRPALFALSHHTLVQADGHVVAHAPEGADFLDVEWQFVDAAPSAPMARRLLTPTPHEVLRVVVCQGDERQAINTALHLPRAVYGAAKLAVWLKRPSELVRRANLTGMYGHIEILGQGRGMQADPLFLRRSLRGMRVNFVYHRAYVNPQATDERQAWYAISEADKYSSIICGNALLVRQWCFEGHNHSEADRRAAYEAEHRRWVMSELIMGFRPAATTNKKVFEHADLVPFEELSAEEQGKDAILIDAMPYILYNVEC